MRTRVLIGISTRHRMPPLHLPAPHLRDGSPLCLAVQPRREAHLPLEGLAECGARLVADPLGNRLERLVSLPPEVACLLPPPLPQILQRRDAGQRAEAD